jgi:hypothetical protein
MDAFPGQDFEEEVSQEDEAEEEGDVVQGAADGAVGIGETDAENGLWPSEAFSEEAARTPCLSARSGGKAFNEEA